MKRAAAVVALVLAAASIPQAAAAAPADWLCRADDDRGAVPADFPVDACIDGTGITLRNDRAVPVVVSAGAGLGDAVPVRTDRSPEAAVVRHTAADDDVLLPGDIVRWPLGPDAVQLTVQPLGPASVSVVARGLGHLLPSVGTPAEFAALARLVRTLAEEVERRERCAEGSNFLHTVACTVPGAVAVGAAVRRDLPAERWGAAAADLLSPARWNRWSELGTQAGPDVFAAAQWAVSAEPSAEDPAAAPPPAVPAPPPAVPAPGPRPTAPGPPQPTKPSSPKPHVPTPEPPKPQSPAPRPAPQPAAPDDDRPDKDEEKDKGEGRGHGRDDDLRDRFEDWLDDIRDRVRDRDDDPDDDRDD